MNEISIKEYIGARYVPQFYDDGEGGAEWKQNERYEPLTVVLYEGNSYTSRQYVPEGISITNTNYWLETGNWNSQIESYRLEVLQFADNIQEASQAAAAAQQTADNAHTAADNAQRAANAGIEASTNNASDISAIEGRGIFAGKLITIGDSYDQGWTPDGINTGWGVVLAEMCGCTGHIDRNIGGCGFVQAINGTTFYTLLQNAVNSIPSAERADYTAVVIGGGFNDGGATPSQALGAITNCSNYVKNNLPNAQLVIAFMPWSRYPDTIGGVQRRNALYAWQAGTVGNRCRFISDCYKALAIKEATRMATDGRHPTQEGQNAIAQHIYNVCQGGSMNYYSPETTLVSQQIICTIKNDIFEICKFGGAFLNLENVTAKQFNGGKHAEIHFDTAMPFYPPDGKAVYNGVTVNCIVSCSREGSETNMFFNCIATLRIRTNQIIDVYLTSVNDTNTNWLSPAYVPVSIFIPQGCWQFPIIDL